MDNPIRLHWLDPRDPHQPFPSPHLAMRDPNGLLAIGGDLSMTRLIRAYSQGIFPWYNPDEPILWWSPDPRAVLLPDAMNVSRSLRKSIRRDDYAVTLDTAYTSVLAACAGTRRHSRGTWLGPDMRLAYEELHRRGYAHSVEVWRGGELVGGLYGVALGRAFFGESMFSRANDTSKIALFWLCEQLRAWDFRLVDCQVASEHLKTLGAVDVSRERFLNLLRPAVNLPGRTGHWRFDLPAPAGREHLAI
ncbi:leucyl/phenylalanyl-tRNA--protein transferase [Hydrocarboniphaga effusa]|jgi:leucyl/phenylalanyl-tRNA--protein transferase|uniref:leucyl/phenylalanyl-tRNA--protein transferase n=1 Tax=Hydrocarboniphaga effusa TaxID=243629 RepID=UPI0035AFE23B